MGRCWQGLSPHCNVPGGRAFWQREEGSNGVDAQAVFAPAASGEQGEQEAHCDPRSALPLPTQAELLGLPGSCLTDSGSAELSEGAGGRNRRVHGVGPWPGSVDPRAGPQARGHGPGERTTPKHFSPGFQSSVRDLREQPARVLPKRPLEAGGEVCRRERAGAAGRPHRPEAQPSEAPALGQPCPGLPGVQGYCPTKGQAAGSVSRHARAPTPTQPR